MTSIELGDQVPSAIPKPATSFASKAHGKILVVDDYEANRDLLVRRLSRKGYEVQEARDGYEALQCIEHDRFDLVLLDIMMPGLDGFAVLRTIRERFEPTELPVIMATARDQSEDVVQALRLGANDYVTKPFDFPVVQARVQSQLQVRFTVSEVLRLDRDLAQRNTELEAAHTDLTEVHQRLKRDLQTAARVQESLLPTDLPSHAGFRFAWRFIPCTELAGDCLNLIALDDHRVALYVLDVSGHGVAAALLSFHLSRMLTRPGDPSSILTRSVFGSRSVRHATTSEVAEELNRRVPMDEQTGQYFTILYGVLNQSWGDFRYITAGHPSPIWLKASGERAEPVGCGGFPIGWVPDARYPERTIQLHPGDRLILHTDGLNEAPGPEQEQFGVKRICEAMTAGRHLSLDASVAQLMDCHQAWIGGTEGKDDATVLALEYLGLGEGQGSGD